MCEDRGLQRTERARTAEPPVLVHAESYVNLFLPFNDLLNDHW